MRTAIVPEAAMGGQGGPPGGMNNQQRPGG